MKADLNITFYKEEKFKGTPIGKIPEDWKIAKLKDVSIKITDGSHWSPKAVKDSKYKIATVENLKYNYIDINSCKPISEKDYMRLAKEGDVPERGDILFSKDGTVGVCFVFKQDNYKIGLLSSIAIIKPNYQILFPEFGAYILKSPRVFWQITGRKTGTALRRIILNDLKQIRIPIPPLEEQKVIAHVLSTVDEAVQKTNEIIEKIKRLKKGLMQELLTKGIGHKEFKNTEIGRIPKEWNTYEVSTIFELYKGTTPSTRIAEYWNGNVPFVTPTDITKLNSLNMIYLEKTEKYLTEKGVRSKGLKLVSENSLLLTSRATIGYLAINKVPVAINQGIISLRPKRKDMNIVFFYYFLQKLRKYLENLSGGSTYREISMSTLMKVKLPLPPLNEQEKIAEILLMVDRRLRVERERREKLERIKKALMDLLLTGKVRVKVIKGVQS